MPRLYTLLAADTGDSSSITSPAPITILVIGQHPVLLWAIERFVNDTTTVSARVITAVVRDQSALEPLFAQRPQIVLVDLGVPAATGLAMLVRVRASLPDVALLALGWLDNEEYRQAAQTAGADAFLGTDELCARLPDAIIAVARARQVV